MGPMLAKLLLQQDVGVGALHVLSNGICRHIFEHCTDNDVAQWEWCMRPSIVLRSECELHSVSAPRFAIRVTFPDGGFMNIRRPKALARNIDGWASKPPGIPSSLAYLDREVSDDPGASKLISRLVAVDESNKSIKRCVADSFFIVPKRIRDEYHVIESSLLHSYGEITAKESPKMGVPFLQQSVEGGGMCGHAVCFSAASLMHEHVDAIHGVSEISALLSHDDISNESILRMAALDDIDVANYLNRINLSSHAQSFSSASIGKRCNGEPILPLANQHYPNQIYAKAVRDYVMSGCPVIAITDTRFMSGPYHRISEDTPPLDGPAGDHAVLILGCAKSSQTFLMNDSRCYPFMEISETELLDARPDSNKGPLVKGVRNPIAPRLVSVCPSDVSLHLLNNVDVCESLDECGSRMGLYARTFRLWMEWDGTRQQYSVSKFSSPPDVLQAFRAAGIPNPGSFSLIGNDCRSDSIVLRTHLGLSARDSESVLSEIQHAFPGGLKWLQRRTCEVDGKRNDYLIVWDASLRHVGVDASVSDPIVLVLERTGESEWVELFSRAVRADCLDGQNGEHVKNNQKRERHNADRRVVVSKRQCSLRPSVITSFQTRWIEVAARKLAAAKTSCSDLAMETYVFMQSERRLLGDASNAVQYMSNNSESDEAVGMAADRLNDTSNKWRLPIVAFASFVPSIAFPANSRQAGRARRALVYLARVAETLANQSMRQQRPVVEIVSGSRTTGVWPASKFEGSCVEATDGWTGELLGSYMQSSEDALGHLMQNLTLVVKQLQGVYNINPLFALELEPGPLYVIREWDTLCRAAVLIEESPLLSPHVGFNLDVGHWRMAGVSTKDVRENDAVFRRIAHAHISGHDQRAHFGDLMPFWRDYEKEKYLPWLDLLCDRSVEDKGEFGFSGYISLEMEAAKCYEHVEEGLCQLRELIEETSA